MLHGKHFRAIISERLELDKNTVDVITSLQKLKAEDQQHIITTLNALIRDAKARNTYA